MFLLRFFGIHIAPPRFQNLLSVRFEINVVHTPRYGGSGKLAVGIEGSDKAPCHEVVYTLFQVAETLRCYSCGNDGMVIGNLRGVEHTLALWEWFNEGSYERIVFLQPIHDGRTLGVDVVRQELGVYTRIRGEFLLVERLYDIEGCFGRETELFVAVHLQRGQVVEMGWGLAALFLLHPCHPKQAVGKGGKGLFTLFFRSKSALCGCKLRVAVNGGQHPIGFRHKTVNLLLAGHDECQRGCLHTTYAQHLSVLPIF